MDKFCPKIGCSRNYLKFTLGKLLYIDYELGTYFFLIFFFYSNFSGVFCLKIWNSPNKLNLLQEYIVKC